MEATRKTPRLSLTLVFVALALTAALYAITSHPGSGKAHAASPQVALAAGTLSVGNSNAGSPITSLSATGMVPGGPSTNGSVTITNGGSLAGAFSLSKSVTGGSALANLLHVVITQSGTTIYDGSVAGMGGISLGTFNPGESRTYDFTVNFPDGGTPSSNTSGDNAGRGVTATVDYVWSASADEPAPPANNTTNPDVSGSQNGGSGGLFGSGGTSSNPSFVTLASAGKQNPLKQHNTVLIKLKCTKACDLVAGGTLSVPNAAKAYKFAQVKKHLSTGGSATLKLKIPKKALKSLKKAIAKKKSSIAKVKVTAKAGGSSSNAQRTIVLKR